MASWYERANEASFKPTSGGYVFQAPSPWMFARPCYYLVTEAQKAELLVGLSRWRLMLLIASLANLSLSIGVVLLMNFSPGTSARLVTPLFRSFGPAGLFLILFAVLALVIAPIFATAQIRLARMMRSALAGAPRTDERIKMGEQLRKIATSVSPVVLALGLIGGIAMIGGGLMLLLEGYLAGHLVRSAALNAVTLLAGALLTAYFTWLVRLKTKQVHG